MSTHVELHPGQPGRASAPRAPRIVLIDADATFRSVLAAWLATQGFDVAAWADGRQALARLDEVRPDLVMTDLDSDDFDGLELAEEIARRPDAPPLVLCTRLSAAGAWDRASLAAIGVRDVIVRPITFPLLADRLRALLEEQAVLAVPPEHSEERPARDTDRDLPVVSLESPMPASRAAAGPEDTASATAIGQAPPPPVAGAKRGREKYAPEPRRRRAHGARQRQ